MGDQEILNPEGINATRDFRQQRRGIRVWGARTVSSDPLWKYVNVRRLFNFIEHSIDRGTQWVVFEPNNQELWGRVRRTIEVFLEAQWRTGALFGAKPEDSFYVKCDRSTMSVDDITNGRLVVEIGIVPTRPAEFVIFRITQLTVDARAN
jgi:phage tail sheath protein FI